MQKRLSKAEIARRLQKLRNYEVAYPKLKKKCERLEQENRELKHKLIETEQRLMAIIEAQMLRIEELERMVFGRRKKKDKSDDDSDSGGKEQNQQNRNNRSKDSYRREIPADSDITETKTYELSYCPDCGTRLIERETVIRYLEDLLLSLGQTPNTLKQVEKQQIECGYCPCCRKRRTALPLRSQTVRLGENVRMFTAYLITNLGLTYDKARCLLKDLAGLQISDGEISQILLAESRKLMPAYQQLQARIRGSPVNHYDETSYPVQKGEQGNFAWIKTATDTTDAVFLLGRTRGKGNAEELRGNDKGLMLTDDYPAYKNLAPGKHALCWAHPKRKFEDLAASKSLPPEKQTHCRDFYGKFCELLTDIKAVHAQPFQLAKRKQAVKGFEKRIEELFALDPLDPHKLQTLKATFLENKHKYLICLLHPDVSLTNNKAERSLRPLVIKKKISFGSKTQRGAETMGILCSVLFSLWWKKPQNFFAEYHKLVLQS